MPQHGQAGAFAPIGSMLKPFKRRSLRKYVVDPFGYKRCVEMPFSAWLHLNELVHYTNLQAMRKSSGTDLHRIYPSSKLVKCRLTPIQATVVFRMISTSNEFHRYDLQLQAAPAALLLDSMEQPRVASQSEAASEHQIHAPLAAQWRFIISYKLH